MTVIATGFETNAQLPEGPVISKMRLDTEAREITAPLHGPVAPAPFTAEAPAEAEPHLKTDSAAPTEPILTQQWEAEDVTSDTPSAALDLFGSPNREAAEEVRLRHEEADVTAEEDTPAMAEEVTTTQVGSFTMLDLDEAAETALTPDDMDVAFTNEQVDAPEAPSQEAPTPEAPAPAPASEPAPAFTAPQPAPAPLENQTGAQELAQRNARRQQSIEDYTKRLRTPSGLTELENEPAYKRRNIQLTPTPASDESQATRLSIDEETGGLKTDNPFLHDNVD